MSRLSWNEIQDRAVDFASRWEGETYEKGESQSFWSEFLTVFGVDRRRHGAFFEYAVKKNGGKQGFIDLFYPGKLLAEQKSGGKDLSKAQLQAYEYLETLPDHDLPLAIVVSDFASFQFIKNDGTNEVVEFSLKDLSKHVKLFGFLFGEQSKHIAEEDPVNRNAAEAMARLHNQLRDDNYVGHDLEVLLVRLVFCLFADDSGIFEHGALRDYLTSRTSEDGSDFGPRIMQIFQILDTPENQRQSSLDEEMASLPYVNGGLFAKPINTPYFNSTMRKDLIRTMDLDWSKVSPAIFGSMFQGVMDDKQRRNLGAHYTSEKNILRVIKPLFLDDLYEEFAAVKRNAKKLQEFHEKIANLKFLDPACGCGNFLVITYRELRRLEHKVVDVLKKGNKTADMLAAAGEGAGTLKVDVDQMYGIEIEEFPSLIAQTALWLTDHQMNMEYSHTSGKTYKRIPLKTSSTIVNDNALTRDWSKIVEPKKLNYILGNPPFIGSNIMTSQMRKELEDNFDSVKSTGLLDFVSAWYSKATKFMKQNVVIQTALVSTNSITQGEQVGVLWKYLLEQGVSINFAHRTFKWTNEAKGVAGVYCVVIGFSLKSKPAKRIFEYPDIKGEPIETFAKTVNPYLIDAPTVFVERRSKPLCDVPSLSKGNQPTDGGNLILSDEEKADLIRIEPKAEKYIKKLIGAKEYIQNINRWCLWLVDCPPNELRQMPLVLERVAKVREMRLSSPDLGTQRLADRPTLFRETQNPESYIVIPSVSSENRQYIPMGFFHKDVISTNLNLIISGGSIYHFGILTSRMHMAWMRVVAGRLKSDYRYSKDIVYNNFIWAEASKSQELDIEILAQGVLDARSRYPNSSLADLYDPLTMPRELTKAHKALDNAVDRLYSGKPFSSDTERVALLFELYKNKINYGKR